MIRWVVISLIILAAALALGLGLLAYAMYTLLGLIVVSRFLAVSWAKNIYAERKPTLNEMEMYDTASISVKIGNRGAIPIPWVLAEDYQPEQYTRSRPPRLKIEGKRQRITLLWGLSQKKLKYDITPQMRGFYQFGPLVLEGGDLFGLYRRFRVAAAPQFLLVYPRIVPLDGYDLASRRPIGEIRLTHRLFEDPTRIAGVRNYQPGDAMNRVHWRTTARLGALHCKIYEPSTIAGATVLLDFHVGSYHKRGEPFRSELAITAAISLANAICQMGQQIGLVTNGRDAAERIRTEGWNDHAEDGVADFLSRRLALAQASQTEEEARLQPVVVPTRRGPEQLQLLRECLARLELNEGLELPDLIEEAGSYLPRDTTMIVILGQVTPAIAVALGAMKMRGYAVEVILITMERDEHEAAMQLLASESVEARHLEDENAISIVCRQQALR
ncbi:MAG: DUF58 domain-containing protein [Gemmatales bacterium]